MQKNQILFIVSLLFAILVTLFALFNAEPVVINLFFSKFSASQALIIFFSAALGAIMVTSLGITQHFKLKSKIKKLEKENSELTVKNNESSNEKTDIIENDSTKQVENEDDNL